MSAELQDIAEHANRNNPNKPRRKKPPAEHRLAAAAVACAG